MFNLQQFISLIPKATEWAQNQELEILTYGVPLSTSQLEDARKVKIRYPEKIRLFRVSQIPLPEDQELKIAAQTIQLITPNTIGLTLRYGIFVRSDYWNSREVVVHELVHTLQYERFGGIQQFLNHYLIECVQFGYPQAPLEQEAINKAKLIYA